MFLTNLLGFVIAVLFSAVITSYYAKKKHFLSVVRSSESSSHHTHTVPTPRVGGIAIFLSFAISLALVLVWNASVGKFAFQAQSLLIIAPACAMFFLGLLDDIFSLRARVKLAGQVVASAPLFWWGFHFVKVPAFVGGTTLGWALAMGLAVFWVVSITNAFNLVDGVDGLAAGVGSLSTTVLLLAAVLVGDSLISVVAIVLAGALLGFLRFNFAPARIFLGDCGSLFTGCLLGSLALALTLESRTPLAALALAICFGLPILDTVLAILRRFLSGRPVFSADREHIHHKLIRRGYSRIKAVVILYGVSTLFAAAAATLLIFDYKAAVLVSIVVTVLVIATVRQCGYLEISELRRIFYRATEQRTIVINNLAIRRATERLSDARNLDEIYILLCDAFESNDFDVVELSILPAIVSSANTSFVRPNDNLFYSWNSKRAAANGNRRAVWKLTLDLVTTGQNQVGTLVLQRRYSRQSLMLDINVLLQEFTIGLADAVARQSETHGVAARVRPIPITPAGETPYAAKARYSI